MSAVVYQATARFARAIYKPVLQSTGTSDNGSASLGFFSCSGVAALAAVAQPRLSLSALTECVAAVGQTSAWRLKHVAARIS